MKKRSLFVLLGAAIILSMTACSLLDSITSKIGTFGSNTDSGADAESGILFSDDFSSTSSGWDQFSSAEGSADYNNGAYELIVNETNYDIWSNPYLSFTDVRVEVDATLAAGPEDNDFGIICRYVDIENFYFSYVTSDGYFSVGKLVDGNQELISGTSMTETDKVNSGSQVNHIRFDCVGSTLTLYVNGEQLGSYEDSEFSSGDVGLIAGTFDESGVDILFDNFVVYQP